MKAVKINWQTSKKMAWFMAVAIMTMTVFIGTVLCTDILNPSYFDLERLTWWFCMLSFPVLVLLSGLYIDLAINHTAPVADKHASSKVGG